MTEIEKTVLERLMDTINQLSAESQKQLLMYAEGFLAGADAQRAQERAG